MYTAFTDPARHALQLANEEALRFNHEYIGTEHLVLGIVAEGSGNAIAILRTLNVDPQKIRVEVEKIFPHGGDPVMEGRLR